MQKRLRTSPSCATRTCRSTIPTRAGCCSAGAAAPTTWRRPIFPTPASARLFKALTLDASVMHVEILGAIDEAHPAVSSFEVSQAGLQRMLTFIRASFAETNGAPVHIDGAHYGDSDGFFEAKGSFNALIGCNTWTAARCARPGCRPAGGTRCPRRSPSRWRCIIEGVPPSSSRTSSARGDPGPLVARSPGTAQSSPWLWSGPALFSREAGVLLNRPGSRSLRSLGRHNDCLGYDSDRNAQVSVPRRGACHPYSQSRSAASRSGERVLRNKLRASATGPDACQAKRLSAPRRITWSTRARRATSQAASAGWCRLSSGDGVGQRHRVLDAHRRALRGVGRHRMRGIADQREAAAERPWPRERHRMDRPDGPVRHGLDQSADLFRRAADRAARAGRVDLSAPAFAKCAAPGDGHDVDRVAAAQRIDDHVALRDAGRR